MLKHIADRIQKGLPDPSRALPTADPHRGNPADVFAEYSYGDPSRRAYRTADSREGRGQMASGGVRDSLNSTHTTRLPPVRMRGRTTPKAAEMKAKVLAQYPGLGMEFTLNDRIATYFPAPKPQPDNRVSKTKNATRPRRSARRRSSGVLRWFPFQNWNRISSVPCRGGKNVEPPT